MIKINKVGDIIGSVICFAATIILLFKKNVQQAWVGDIFIIFAHRT